MQRTDLTREKNNETQLQKTKNYPRDLLLRYHIGK